MFTTPVRPAALATVKKVVAFSTPSSARVRIPGAAVLKPTVTVPVEVTLEPAPEISRAPGAAPEPAPSLSCGVKTWPPFRTSMVPRKMSRRPPTVRLEPASRTVMVDGVVGVAARGPSWRTPPKVAVAPSAMVKAPDALAVLATVMLPSTSSREPAPVTTRSPCAPAALPRVLDVPPV